jgi:phosphatidate phosphatase APP1
MNFLIFFTDILNFPFRRLKSIIKKQLGWVGNPIIQAYRGYGNNHHIFIKGRVIEDTGLSQPEVSDNIWQNILAMIKRYSSSGISEVEVFAEFQGERIKCVTDEDGFFTLNIDVKEEMVNDKDWQHIHFYMKGKGRTIVHADGEILLSRKKAQYGVITDIDDTLLISHATNARKKLRLMLFKNAKTRLPFDGVAAFYCALEQGFSHSEAELNPFFYVSSSEWNLYDLLADFCQHHNLPKGPFLLRQVSVSLGKIWKAGGGNHNHKLDKIRHILSLHEEREFILIGDSGQYDAEIYKQTVQEYPERINTIYIRDVHPLKHEWVQKIASEVKKMGADMLLVKDTEEAAVDAIRKGYLHPSSLKKIVDEKTYNQRMESDLQQVMERLLSPEHETH